jgi:hypothetical protein
VRSKDREDFEGSFRVRYDTQENALYVAVEVRDESTVIDTTAGGSWNTQDGCEIYVDVAHRTEGSPGVYCEIWGNTRRVFGSGARLEDFKVGMHRDIGMQRYEWQIDIEQMSNGKVQLNPGMVLGFNVQVHALDKNICPEYEALKLASFLCGSACALSLYVLS